MFKCFRSFEFRKRDGSEPVLEVEEVTFDGEAAAIACERTVGAYDAMTGSKDRYGIGAVGVGDRADGFGHA